MKPERTKRKTSEKWSVTWNEKYDMKAAILREKKKTIVHKINLHACENTIKS